MRLQQAIQEERSGIEALGTPLHLQLAPAYRQKMAIYFENTEKRCGTNERA